MGRTLIVIRNLLKAWGCLAVLLLVLGAIGWELGGYRLLLLFLGSAVLLAGAVYWYADRIVMGMVGASQLVEGEAPALHSTVERLSMKARVIKPKLYVMRDGYPRALSAGRGAGGGSALAVSVGLLGVASPAELEGVIAHEIAHLRHRDVLVQTLAVIVAAALVDVSRVGGFLQRALLFVLAPIAAAFVHLLLSPRRELAADRMASALLGSGDGLADALLKLDRASDLVSFQASPATEPLYTVNPFEETGLAALFVTHPPLRERLVRLTG